MSRRNFRPSRTATAVAAADTRPKAVRRDGLKEISLDSWRNWESITSELKEYFYQHYGALGNIFPDPLKLTATQNYRADTVVPDNSFPAASLEEAADPAGVQRARCIAAWAVAGKLNSQYLSDRASGYRTLRSLTSDPLNTLLALDPLFATISEDDPLALYKLQADLTVRRITRKVG